MKTFKAGQKEQLVGDLYPLPKKIRHKYKFEIIKGKNIASVDSDGILHISAKAKAGDTFTVKTTAVLDSPYITVKPAIVDYLVS